MANKYSEELIEEIRKLGKQVRNYSYKQITQDDRTDIQRNIIHKILQGHPEGITDLEICNITGFPRSSVTARRNEIPNVVGVGIAKIVCDGEADRLNTLWSVNI